MKKTAGQLLMDEILKDIDPEIADGVAETGYVDVQKHIDRLDQLLESEDILDCLRSAGVDNWEGWDEAMGMYHENKELGI